ncbi:cation-transporting P-type ATPase [Algiphilus sp.]|uniref:cation-transporting P-type ATPase n=1 Tax=Algiphilus sp. TaxID=1872431 RepID=UPI002A621157|nr:cation-transporting P-type ATPase [Pseudomonadota bacterium]
MSIPPTLLGDAHARGGAEVLQQLNAAPSGLSSAEAEARLAHFGGNHLPATKTDSLLKRFLRQFHNLLIYLLLLAAVGTALLGHWLDCAVILGVVIVNAAIGVVQEGKAEKALQAIAHLLSPRASVQRDGRLQTVDAALLVPGDVVVVESGDRVPADLRVLEQHGLRIDEAALTGESAAVDKDAAAVPADADLGDRQSMAFSGTLVVAGRGRGVVVATGSQTEIGKVSAMLARVQPLTTPLLRQMAQFGRWLSAAIVALAGLTFGFGLMVRDYAAADIFLAAVSLAVAAIPEGLPAIMTITLAIGVQGMARRNAIIRRLPAVETLGAVTVICSDKTGTLTRNEMTVSEIALADLRVTVSGSGYAPEGVFRRDGSETLSDIEPRLLELLRCGLACNDAQLQERDGIWTVEGDPTEGALIAAALKAGIPADHTARHHPRTDSIPFASEQQYMATLHHGTEGDALAVLKGAPERVLAMCSRQRTADGDAPLDMEHWQLVLDEMAAKGQRLLAIALRTMARQERHLDHHHVADGLTLIGVVGMMDPPRDEAVRAVAACHSAGIAVKMITGDHAVTARAIGARLGIGDGHNVIDGRQIEAMDDATLQTIVKQADIFARTSPAHKLRLVHALQRNGDVVAMTGDGVNDAPALKRADVGVAMGRKGTEAAKEASEMVLADDNFASIAEAVRAGRGVYDNLRKAILFILPTNGGQALKVVAAIALGMSLPITPVQVLWVNLVISVTLALALAFEAPEADVMRRPPRSPNAPMLDAFLLWRVAFVSALLVSGTFGHFLWTLAQGGDPALARTVAINTLVIGQVFYLFNSRFLVAPALRQRPLFGGRPVCLSVAALLLLQTAFTYAPPLQALFGTTAIDAQAWLRILLFGAALFLTVEAEKTVLRRQQRPVGDPDLHA